MRLHRAATPSPLPAPRAMYAKLASTLAEPINAEQSLHTYDFMKQAHPKINFG